MKNWNRVRAFALFAGSVFFMASVSCQRGKEVQKKQPNIFFFFADDWGKYASVYGSFSPNKVINTPSIDKFAEDGITFNNAHVNSPSCTPCRSALLSGQYFYRTGLGAILQGAVWDTTIPSYPLILEEAGYHVGFTYKAWGPGKPANAPYGGTGNEYVPAGRRFNQFSQNVTKMVAGGETIDEAKEELYREGLENFRAFLAERKDRQPFCYWFGPTNTHRKWTKGSGKDLWGLSPDDLKGKMPGFIPDVPEIREDMCDYLGEVLALDNMLGRFLEELGSIGERENTLVVVSGDHGIPGFPRGKCNLYPLGTNVSLFVQWPGVAKGGREIDDFVNLMDLAPTFLCAAGLEPPDVMTGKSIIPLLLSGEGGLIDKGRDYVVTGRERHVAAAREGCLPYPQRAIKTKDFLYIRNFEPDREPMGSPWCLKNNAKGPSFEELENNTFAAFPDLDASPTKAWMIKHRNEAEWEMQWRLGFEKRPGEELYDLRNDPDYLKNVALDPGYSEVKTVLAQRLMQVLKSTGDPRVTGDGKIFDLPPYVSECNKYR